MNEGRDFCFCGDGGIDGDGGGSGLFRSGGVDCAAMICFMLEGDIFALGEVSVEVTVKVELVLAFIVNIAL